MDMHGSHSYHAAEVNNSVPTAATHGPTKVIDKNKTK
jgi:hypothetical protein